jgi:hypothetical protein
MVEDSKRTDNMENFINISNLLMDEIWIPTRHMRNIFTSYGLNKEKVY